MIKIPIEIGDIVRVGRFKNKRVKVKSIEYDAYGLPIINGRPLLTMRIEKLMQPKSESVIKLKDVLKEVTIKKDVRIHMSKTPKILEKKKYTQVDGMKPNGFWYGFGEEWIDWTKTEMPEWVGKYIYEVKIPNNVLKITSYKELLQFNEEFKTEQIMIDWKKVASKYDGIEIVPYQQKARMNLLWYYGWDIASGCIWNLNNSTINLITDK
jgi:hypothetical protein